MDVQIKDGKLHIETLIEPGRPSKTGSGDNLVVASTGGFLPIPGSDIRVNLVAIKRR